MATKAKVGILGSGDVGKALGTGFATLGHPVMVGSRSQQNEKLVAWTKTAGPNASTGTFADAAKFGEVLVIATLWGGTRNAIEMAGVDSFAGKVVIDCTNPLDFSAMPPTLSVGCTDSAGEQIQRWLPKAKVVKCFNIVGNPHMFRPSFPGGRPDMFLCGNDEAARKTVADICQAFGWGVVDLGGIEASRYLEPMAMVWISVFARTGQGNHAFALLRK